MKIKVILNSGVLLEDEIEYAVIKNEDGQTGILKNHIPIILTINDGYVKITNKDITCYIVVYQGIVEFKNNELSVLAIDAQIGNTRQEAQEAFQKQRKDKLEQAKKEVVDFSEKEKELKDNIQKGRAGNL